MKQVLGIETSCDETAVAVARVGGGKREVLANWVSSQVTLHAPFGGVVPELATREHLRNLPVLVPKLMQEAALDWPAIDAIAVTAGPGLAPALLVGYSYARALGVATDKPVWGMHHLEGHLLSPFLESPRPIEFPFVGLIVSGGHTVLVAARGWNRYEKLGSTVDDAAGEAFDKVARLLGLGYPGGPAIEKLAAQGDPSRYPFPQSFPERGNFQFSFSGLKTSVRYFLDKNPKLLEDAQWRADVAASFQKAVVEVLVRKALDAAKKEKVSRLLVSGGVVANQALRSALKEGCARQGLEFWPAGTSFCTDNAAMIAVLAGEKIAAGLAPEMPEDATPQWDFFKEKLGSGSQVSV